MSQAYLRIFFKAIEKYWANFLGWVCYSEKSIRKALASSRRAGWLSGCSVKLPSVLWRILTLWSGCLKSPQTVHLQWPDRAEKNPWRSRGVPVSTFGAVVAQKWVGGNRRRWVMQEKVPTTWRWLSRGTSGCSCCGSARLLAAPLPEKGLAFQHK